MALTQTQIEELFRFCEKKLVRHYDLQVELVDHLASRIEEEMATNNKLSFEETLKKVYAGFGLFGFAHIVRERGESLQKHHNRLYHEEIKRFFTLPKALLTISLVLLFFQLGRFIPLENRFIVFYGVLIPCFVIQAYYLNSLRKKLQKKLMLTQYLPATSLLSLFYLFDRILFKESEVSNPIFFALLCVSVIITEGAFVTVTKRITQKARLLYPEAFKAA
jgi:hypothetical protein